VSISLDVSQTNVDQVIRLLAMTFERPLMIGTTFTTLVPSLIDDENLRTNGEGTQPPTKPSVMGLCVYSCGLFKILADILVSFYSPKLDRSPKSRSDKQDMLTRVLAFDSCLDHFFNGVPQSLKADVGNVLPTQEGHLSLQREVLHCWYVSHTGSSALF
jgi:hypothetical protein